MMGGGGHRRATGRGPSFVMQGVHAGVSIRLACDGKVSASGEGSARTSCNERYYRGLNS